MEAIGRMELPDIGATRAAEHFVYGYLQGDQVSGTCEEQHLRRAKPRRTGFNAWDHFPTGALRRITQVGGGSSAVYRYDGGGNRVMKVETGVPACRWWEGRQASPPVAGGREDRRPRLSPRVGRDRGVSKTPPRPAGDGLGSPSSGLFGGSEKLGEYRSNATRFFHNDHLGTTKAVTDHTGLVLEQWDHYPFGEEWVSGLTGDRYRYPGTTRAGVRGVPRCLPGWNDQRS